MKWILLETYFLSSTKMILMGTKKPYPNLIKDAIFVKRVKFMKNAQLVQTSKLMVNLPVIDVSTLVTKRCA